MSILTEKNKVRIALATVELRAGLHQAWLAATDWKSGIAGGSMQQQLYALVGVGFLLISSFILFLGHQYYQSQELHRCQYQLQRLMDRIEGAHTALRTAARLGAATADSRWEQFHQEKEVEMDNAIQQLITIYARQEQTNLGFDLQISSVLLLEMENEASYLVRDGRAKFSEATHFLDGVEYQEKTEQLEKVMKLTESHMVNFLQRRIAAVRNRAIGISAILLALSIIPVFPIVRVLRVTKDISKEREVAERQLTRLNSCLLSFESNSMVNIQSLVDLCGELLGADGVAYQRIEGETVCTVGWYGNVFCRPAELLQGSLAEFARDNISVVPIHWSATENPEQIRKLASLVDADCRAYSAQVIHSQQEVVGILHVFYRKEIAAIPQNLRFITIVTSAIAPEERRLKAAETLRTSEASYRLMADNATDLIMRSTLNGTMVYVSPACKKLGYTNTDLLGKGLDHLWHPDDVSVCWERSPQGYRTLMEGTTVHRMKNKGGDYLWFETVSRQVVNNEERWGREMILVSREITERKQAEEALLREREQLAITLRSITDGVITTDLDNRIILMNRVAEDLTSWPLAEAQGRPLADVFQSSHADTAKLAAAANGKPSDTIPLTLQNRRGENLYIEASCAPIKHFDDSIIGHLLVFRDQTEKQRLQAQVALSSKLQSIGQLAAGIAHEINTPMQFIGDNTSFLQRSYADWVPLLEMYRTLAVKCSACGQCDELIDQVNAYSKKIDVDYLVSEVPVAIKETLSGVDRVTKLVKAMKTFSHPTQGQMQLSDLNQSIEATTNVSRNEWKYTCDLSLYLDPALPLVPCLIDEFNQVVLNMITNSVDSIKEAIDAGRIKRGAIDITTENKDNAVHIIIRDNGLGMPDEVLRKIFDPFFTTKEPGKGTGQGLAISHDIIVNKHKGRIDVTSEIGAGTCFTITLPLNNEGVS